LRKLKEKYHKAGLRMVEPAKIKVSQKQRQRLPPTILSYTQTKPKTKTNNPVEPLPKQIIVEPLPKTNNPVEPQMNIVQESRKRKGEELSHLAKRTRPTLLPHRQIPAFSFSTPSPVSLDEISLSSGPVEFGTQSLADEIKQALEEEGLGEETEDEEEDL